MIALRSKKDRFFFHLTLMLVLLTWSVAVSFAQDSTTKRGFQPGGSYALGDFETINTTNGNLMLRLPLASLPAGRGGLSASINLVYNSKLYDSGISYFRDPTQQCQFGSEGEPISCPYYQKSLLKASAQGGWRYSLGYGLELTDRRDQYSSVPYQEQPQCQNGGAGYQEMTYVYKLTVKFPDGSSHEMRPLGFTDWNSADPLRDYFHVRPDGLQENCGGSTSWYSGTLVYYSTDGSFHRLEVQHDADSYWWNNPWTLYLRDGTRVTGGNAPQRIYDRNNNYVEVRAIENYNGTGQLAYQLVDQLNRSITLEFNGGAAGEDTIVSQGFGSTLIWKVKWKTIAVNKSYLSCTPGGPNSCPYGTEEETFLTSFNVVDQITLPQQDGQLNYTFSYNASNYVSGSPPPSIGWGEVSGVVLPSGAQASYQYAQDNNQNALTQEVLKDYPAFKTLSFNQVYDGVTTAVNETWRYEIVSDYSSITAPDGGVTIESFRDTRYPFWDAGLVHKTVGSDGSVVERIWAKNNLQDYGAPSVDYRGDNPYPKTEFRSIKNAAGVLVKTAIKDYHYDKNGNVTRVAEYDWVDYGVVPRDAQSKPTGLPSGVQPARVTVNGYYNSTPDASQLASGNNVYWMSQSPRLRNAIAWNEVQTATGQPITRSEFFYDNFSTTGNLTEQKSWDSTKGEYSNPLTTNSISVSTQYNQYGTPILSTDAMGIQTQVVYDPIGGYSDLYPTQIKSAFGTSLQRTEMREYNFNTGLITRVTDVDNNVSTSTLYDVFGRPTLVKNAEEKPEETRTTTEYCDVNRRVIVRSDLNIVGDGSLVTIQHYDQLGRVRLTRQLEDATATNATDESTGIKVQTRYAYAVANNYQLTSNPYRAATSNGASSEAAMGWTRTKADNGGRILEAQTFGGAGLPEPWGSNTTSTGAVTTGYDAEFTTVTDQAGKLRRSRVNGLGQLIRVDEPDSSGNLGSITAPAQATNYTYDGLSNLTQVSQGSQPPRIFLYDSLSRLTSAANPESGPIGYQYNANGSLVVKTEARSVSTHFSYDALNRPVRRWYNGSSMAAATTNNIPVLPSGVGTSHEVEYSYDAAGVTNSKGRLTGVTSVSSYAYTGYDALGRVLGGTQTTDGQAYTMTYSYDLAGNMKSQTYPSGKIVASEYDAAGRPAGVRNQASGLYYAGAAATDSTNRLQYTAHGATSRMRLGNGLWEHTNFNSRLQPAEIGLGTSSTNSSVLQLDYGYGITNNNGNVLSQTITVPTIGAVGGFAATQTYTYDPLNRLATAQENASPNWTQNFSYDRFGNRNFAAGTNSPAQLTASNNPVINPANNRIDIAASGQTGYSYDAAGNLTHDSAGHAFGYDAENKQTTYDGGATTNGGATYCYDGDGKRVKKIAGGAAMVTTVFVYNVAGQIVAEYINTSPSGPGGISYLTSDTLGSPRVITGSNQAVKARHDYLPFGEEIGGPHVALVGGRTTTQGYVGDNTRQKFTSKERDIETGLDYFLARHYSSTPGRFTSVDPENYQAMRDLSDPQSWNAYSYVNNNPLGRVDPDGMGFLSKLKNWLVWNVWGEEEDVKREEQKRRDMMLELQKKNGGELIIQNFAGELVRVDPATMNRANVWLWSGQIYSSPGSRDLTPMEAANVIDATANARRVIGKQPDLDRPGALKPGESKLDLPNQGNPRANWAQNSSRLREAMREGHPIRDASVNPKTGALRDDTGFLRAERNLLRSNGWKYNPGTKMWHPPGK